MENNELMMKSYAMQVHESIMQSGTVAAQALMRMCQGLKKMRDEKLFRSLGYDDFDVYCEEMAHIRARQAYNYIATFERVGEEFLQSNASLGITKLELISRLPGDIAAEITEDGTAEKMSVREIKALVEENKRLSGQVALFEGELEKAREENDANAMALEEAKCELRDRPIQVVEKNLSAEQSEKLRAETKATVEAEMKKQFASELKEKIKKAEEKTEKKFADKIKDAENATAEKERLENIIKERDAEAEKQREEVEKLRRELSVASAVGAEIKVYFDAIKNYFVKANEKIESLDEEERNRYKAAFRGLLSAMGEVVGEDEPCEEGGEDDDGC